MMMYNQQSTRSTCTEPGKTMASTPCALALSVQCCCVSGAAYLGLVTGKNREPPHEIKGARVCICVCMCLVTAWHWENIRVQKRRHASEGKQLLSMCVCVLVCARTQPAFCTLASQALLQRAHTNPLRHAMSFGHTRHTRRDPAM